MYITAWAESLTKEIYDAWKTRYVFWKPGIKVWYAPVVQDPKLLIITLQPGGGQADFEAENLGAFEAGDFSTTSNDYVEATYVSAKKIRSFFDFDPTHEILKHSVVVPLVFFRSPSISVWNNDLSPNKRAEMEGLCFAKTKEIVDTVNPEKILVIGMKAYKKLKELLGTIQDEKVAYARRGGAEELVITASSNGTPICAVMHFSGSHINKTDWQKMKEMFKGWL